MKACGEYLLGCLLAALLFVAAGAATVAATKYLL